MNNLLHVILLELITLSIFCVVWQRVGLTRIRSRKGEHRIITYCSASQFVCLLSGLLRRLVFYRITPGNIPHISGQKQRRRFTLMCDLYSPVKVDEDENQAHFVSSIDVCMRVFARACGVANYFRFGYCLYKSAIRNL